MNIYEKYFVNYFIIFVSSIFIMRKTWKYSLKELKQVKKLFQGFWMFSFNLMSYFFAILAIYRINFLIVTNRLIKWLENSVFKVEGLMTHHLAHTSTNLNGNDCLWLHLTSVDLYSSLFELLNRPTKWSKGEKNRNQFCVFDLLLLMWFW